MTKQTWSLTREEMNDIALYALNAGQKTNAAVVQNGDLDKAVKAMCSLAQEAADYMIRRKSTGADLYEYLPNADPDDDDGRPRGYVQAGLEGTAEYLRQLPEGTRGGWVIYLLEILEDARWEERTFEDMLIDIQDDLTTRLDAHHW